jgi:hypothetical protein
MPCASRNESVKLTAHRGWTQSVGRPYLGDLVVPIFAVAIIAARSPSVLYYIDNALSAGKAGLEGYKRL